MIEVFKQALEALEYTTNLSRFLLKDEANIGPMLKADEAITSLSQAIKELESQETVAMWLILDRNINHLQVESIQRLIDRAKHAHMTDIKLRINGQDEWYEADWLKHMNRTHPQPKAEQKPKRDLMFSTVAMQERHDERIERIVETLERIKHERLAKLEAEKQEVSQEHDNYEMDIECTKCGAKQSGVLTVYTHPPQRTWQGLTNEEREKHRDDWHSNIHDKEFKAIEAKLKQKNGFAEEKNT